MGKQPRWQPGRRGLKELPNSEKPLKISTSGASHSITQAVGFLLLPITHCIVYVEKYSKLSSLIQLYFDYSLCLNGLTPYTYLYLFCSMDYYGAHYYDDPITLLIRFTVIKIQHHQGIDTGTSVFYFSVCLSSFLSFFIFSISLSSSLPIFFSSSLF